MCHVFYLLRLTYRRKRTILGATLEWAVCVRSDKRIQKHPKPTVADPSIRVYNVNNYSYNLPLLAIYDSQSNPGHR